MSTRSTGALGSLHRLRSTSPLALLVLLAAITALPAPASAQTPAPTPPAGPSYSAEKPTERALYRNGNEGRFLLDGQWLFRRDPADQGIAFQFYRQRSTVGWSGVQVPHDWTAGDNSTQSMLGGVGWYRRDFRLPDKRRGLAWILRFESANYRATAWLNGRQVGEHAGGYLPFEVPLERVKRGVNRLVVRIDSRRLATDLPPGGAALDGLPRGGWWNHSGLIREVYLRRVQSVDMGTVRVTPTVPKLKGSARVAVQVALRNYTAGFQTVRLRGRYGRVPIGLGTTGIPAGATRVVSRTITVRKPKLWSPQDPNLYTVKLTGTADGEAIEGYGLRSGIRRIDVTADGRLSLNGRLLDVRGFGVHEDNVATGGAVTNAIRNRYVGWAKEIGATILRSHEPWSPYLEEQADRKGILLWSEIPMWAALSDQLELAGVRAAGVDQLRSNILANGNHPSILLWSIGNELASQPGPPEAEWIRQATGAAKELDPTRPVALALIGYRPVGCPKAYRPLDVVGINAYFGWYPGADGQTADRELLGPFLDLIRGCYPTKAMMVTEFGAEGTRSGPPEEKGTYEFQDDYLRYTLGVFAGKPYLSGAIYWTLQWFRVRPGYTGGDPLGQPPFHRKGPFDLNGNKTPVFNLLQQSYAATRQFIGTGAAAAPA